MNVQYAPLSLEMPHESRCGIVQLQNVSKTYERGSERVAVLQSVSLTVEEGDFLALMGPSGSGKSTLLNIIGSLDRPSSGTVRVSGVDLQSLSDAQQARWRATHVGLIFQMFHLHPAFTAEQNVALPLRLLKMSGRERRRRARAALSLVGLSGREQHKPSQLSGGQQQRVAIARAIVSDPALLLCDEPTGNLDRRASEEILDLLSVLNAQHRKTIVLVTHDPLAAVRAKRRLVVAEGSLSSEVRE